MIDRRQLLAWTAAVTVAGCSSTPNIQVTAQVVADIGQIASGLSGSLASISGLPIFGTINGYVTSIVKLANSVSTTTPISSAQSTVQQIETLVNDILDVAAGIPLPPPFGPAIQAAAILLPIVEAALNMVVSKPRVMAARLQVPVMSPDQARLILSNAAQGK